jgi:hypothetical protein
MMCAKIYITTQFKKRKEFDFRMDPEPENVQLKKIHLRIPSAGLRNENLMYKME